MSKRSKAAKKAAKAAKVNRPQSEAEFRASNGRATLQDVDFVTRMRREVNGMDGYSGYSRNGQTAEDKYQGNGYGYRGDQGSKNGYSWRDTSKDFDNSRVSSHLLPMAKDEGIFCVESNEVTGSCPLNPKVPSILVDTKVWDGWLKATHLYDSEWIALLFGRESITSKSEPCYVIDGFYFPPQTATGTHVEVPTGVIPKPGVVGAIHSHVGMSVFFSATDKAHSNWPVEIVINRKREYEAVARYKLKCGEWAKGKATVYLTGDQAPKETNPDLDAAFTLGAEMQAKSRAVVVATPVVATPAITTTPVTDPVTEPIQETLALTVPSSDDGSALQAEDNHKDGPIDPLVEAFESLHPELVDELACTECEGDGWVNVTIGHIVEAIECKTCGGTGLSAEGLDMQASLVKLKSSREGTVQ